MSGPVFDYRRADRLAEALAQGAAPGAAYLAGGTDLLPLWKVGVTAPEAVVDISRLPCAEVFAGPETLTLGALCRLADVAADPQVAAHYPLVAQALLVSASGQVRNMATVGGNLLQRTRCAYFRTHDLACNKRAPGSGCGALAGENRQAALFGISAACVATHPSDLAVALCALDAKVRTEAPDGGRALALDALYRLPGDTPERDTVLIRGELLTAIEVADGARFASRSTYLKVRDRASFEFAVVSVAAALEIVDGTIVAARLAAGGVAPKPWRLAASEAALVGRSPSAAAFADAAALAVEGAQALADNRFKIGLLRHAVARAVADIGGRA